LTKVTPQPLSGRPIRKLRELFAVNCHRRENSSAKLDRLEIWFARGGDMVGPVPAHLTQSGQCAVWPAPGSEDTELGVFMEPEVSHGKTKVYTRVQA
jgi:hypothetical protein